ncbi:LLM class flavin-dependent oxidoreductase [Allosalinactinospora lopnorensis]|uniref:LLM class flavin-dependent oxidoreductase n=1 Tax=Allosalinactinospora lopnorensis TaxID=1352348 RepID=UPI000AB58734|nr:LLM class flavin-dependent oxidoreductase [Allosalinactinospora lopnorensis]
MALRTSCAFNTSLESHEHARIAEQLGYQRAWFFDSPALYPDVWVQLCRAAERTERIGLGPGVMVPALRHPMTNAAGIATLVSLAGEDRVAVGVGSGFTGRLTLGKRPVPWSEVAEYIRVVRALLRGERAHWDGAVIEMLHRPGFAPPRPIDVPFLVGAQGDKGATVARELGDGVFGAPQPVPGFDWSAVLTFGTVLADGEDPGSPRAVEAAGHAAGVIFHFALEFDRLEMIPDGRRWAAAYEEVPAEIRHLAVHDGHLSDINEYDRPFITGELLTGLGLALGPDGWREKLAQFEEAGATEVVYQPAGPDIARELETFAEAARG